MKAAAAVVTLAIATLAGGALGAQPAQPAPPIRVLPIRGNVYVLFGAGANVTVSVGRDGVLIVDSGTTANADALLATVLQLSQQITSAPQAAQSCVGLVQGCSWWRSSELLATIAAPPVPRLITGIINTSADEDHVGGNEVVAAAGRSFGLRNLPNGAPGAWILAHENVALALSRSNQLPLLPTETYFGHSKELNFFNGEAVIVTHHPAAHTDADSIVFFRGSEVLVTGDVFTMTSYPVIDVASGGTIQGVIDALNSILDVAVVEHMMEGGTMIVPGHGRLADAADVAYYRDMVTIMRDRVREYVRRGMTLEEIQAARPTRDYDGRWGRDPAYTPRMFVEAIYRTLDGTSG